MKYLGSGTGGRECVLGGIVGHVCMVCVLPVLVDQALQPILVGGPFHHVGVDILL